MNHPAWYGLATLPFGSLPLPDGLLADQIATYRRLPIEEPEIETVMEDSFQTYLYHSSLLHHLAGLADGHSMASTAAPLTNCNMLAAAYQRGG